MWRCGSQDYLYSGSYKQFLFSLLLSSAEALLVCEARHSVVLAFPFHPLSALPLFTTCLPPLFLSSAVSPSFLWSQYMIKTFPLLFLQPSVLLSPPLHVLTLQQDLPLSCCCSVSRESPMPCWGWGPASLRSRTGKWPRWPKRPPGRKRCGWHADNTVSLRKCDYEGEKQRFRWKER